jgi:hypothetical protein
MVVIESNRALLIEIICFRFETLHRLSYGLLRMHPRAEIVNESLFFSANLKNASWYVLAIGCALQDGTKFNLVAMNQMHFPFQTWACARK